MSQTLKFKRGNNVNFESQSLEAGEPAFILDTGKFYIGNGTEKVLINPDQANAETATKLKVARTIALSGDVTGSASFDGSANISIAATLPNSGVTAGTFSKVTVDAKGRVTAGTTLVASDIGLGNVTNESKATMLTSPTLTGIPTAPTATAGTNTTQIASTAFVTTAVANKTTITGNAGTATKLQTARTITLSGDLSGSVSFDGSANVSLSASIASIDGGTF